MASINLRFKNRMKEGSAPDKGPVWLNGKDTEKYCYFRMRVISYFNK